MGFFLKVAGNVKNKNNYCNQVIEKYTDYIVKGNRRLLLTDGLLLREACISTNAKTIVEIGSMDGGSSLILGDYARINNGHLFCIEPYLKSRWKGNIENEKLQEHITMMEASSPHINTVTLQRITNVDRNEIDVLFIDGDHRTSRTIADYVFWEKYVKIGGIIIFHDYCGGKGVKEWVRSAIKIILDDYEKDLMYLQSSDQPGKLELFGISEGGDRGAIAYRKVK